MCAFNVDALSIAHWDADVDNIWILAAQYMFIYSRITVTKTNENKRKQRIETDKNKTKCVNEIDSEKKGLQLQLEKRNDSEFYFGNGSVYTRQWPTIY